MKDHAKSALITLYSNNHSKVTHQDHVYLPRTQKALLDKATRINTVEGRPFSYLDYPELKPDNFRQKIKQLKRFLNIYQPGRPTFYVIKDVDLPGDSHKITLTHTGGTELEFDNILQSLKDQPAMVHDLRFNIQSDLYDKLIDSGLTPNKTNNSILLDIFDKIHPNYNFKMLVYPKKIQLIVGCSYKPIICNAGSFQDLTFTLGMVISHLQSFVNSDFIIEPVQRWVISQYHFNKDGHYEVSGKSFNHTWEDFQIGCMRLYNKKLPDGTRKPRLERVKTPHTTFEKEFGDLEN